MAVLDRSEKPPEITQRYINEHSITDWLVEGGYFYSGCESFEVVHYPAIIKRDSDRFKRGESLN